MMRSEGCTEITKKMNLRKTLLLSILMGYAFIAVNAQDKKFSFFGSYNYGIGNITAEVSSKLGYPLKDEVSKLKSGAINQVELGVFYRSFGLGFIHNTYAANATTNYENADINYDMYFENGTLSDEMDLHFNGLELLYKIPVFDNKLDVTGKIGAGYQSYRIHKDFNLMGTYPSHFNNTLTETKLTKIAGVEVNYHLWKFIGVGFETSIIPGKYTKLKDKEHPSYIYTDNVTRLSTGIKIKITI